ncbi:hypothetical protein SEA_TINIBUG_7 [Mycobacterium Phage TiniBug]|uniref:Terminase small subunit n=2 Tax=Anayavirus TaxID=2946797 RepID=A0A222Z0B4_9CAUD|nr:terminase small subunit [Mycobacterium phage Bella96]YP_009953988.1 terminase small subunit [Mycobacterium phage Urkel]AOZ61338.1 hypothetical protein SEA_SAMUELLPLAQSON_7 [Mycobacterium phage SamuelLPlaqson]AOZ61435.1 hypothetical protein SEA_DRHAYES_7 [Mycobacterium phage DrHayes]WNM75362.1 hypothetical protein SEA_TINIBUG_7 [Mycobacterium Phage TiniBug]AOZ61532.1 hypothetical protein SEA_URKEL_7 [Mycobacterium phage Urkel]ASR77939.1 hypothetical protein SEA_BELLA96_7 [Mycobacterium phag
MTDRKLDRLDELRRLHERISGAVFHEETPPRDLASLSRRLMEISKEIEAIELQRAEQGEGAPEAPADEPFDGSDL